jgi:hypothetical protein
MIFASALLLLLTSCSKDTASTQNDSDKNPIQIIHSTDTTYFGSWYWIRTQGGFAGETITPSSAGYRQKIIFKRDSSYEFYRDDVLMQTTQFSIRRQLPSGAHDSVDLIFYADHATEIILERIWLQGSDTLHLDDFNIMDGFYNTYVRIGLSKNDAS